MLIRIIIISHGNNGKACIKFHFIHYLWHRINDRLIDVIQITFLWNIVHARFDSDGHILATGWKRKFFVLYYQPHATQFERRFKLFLRRTSFTHLPNFSPGSADSRDILPSPSITIVVILSYFSRNCTDAPDIELCVVSNGTSSARVHGKFPANPRFIFENYRRPRYFPNYKPVRNDLQLPREYFTR